ncbi:MAG: hypothetical protein VYE40_04335 [Myxococcota bacterium]|nr:hypothetical protein [Myxococcota bacterium]
MCRQSAQGILNHIEEYGPLPEEMDKVLLIGFKGKQDFEHLRGVKKIAILQIHSSPNLEDLTFLANLEEVGSLHIESNQSLRSLRGLENVKAITFRATIAGNDNLETLQGLENVERVGRVDEGEGLIIRNNPKLENLEALGSFQESFNLNIQSNNAMRSFGTLPSLELLGGISVRFNNELQDLGSAPSLRDIVKGMVIEKNKKFPDCEAEKYLAQVEEFDAGFLFENNLPNSTCADLGQ